MQHRIDHHPPDRFPTDPSGLPEAARPALLELAHGDTLELRVGPVAKRLGGDTVVRWWAWALGRQLLRTDGRSFPGSLGALAVGVLVVLVAAIPVPEASWRPSQSCSGWARWC